MRKVSDEGDPRCRRCKRNLESLGHIIGKFQNTKSKRIHRYDGIKHLIRKRSTKKHLVLDEPEIVVNGSRFKSDLVVKTNEGGFLVLNVTVRY